MSTANSRRTWVALVLTACTLAAGASRTCTEPRETLTVRGRPQVLRLYGERGGIPAIVSSGDGGWIHLAPHVAEVLAGHGFFVVGLDTRAYLEGFTSGSTTLAAEDEPGDVKLLADFAARGTTEKPILIGVSEGAGLSVLAASDPSTRPAIAGVIGLGLSDLNELGWRWKDALIYITHGMPHEPTFSAAAVVGRMSPVPLALIHSTRDEFVPLGEARQVFEHARAPKRFWIVTASNHRFSDNLTEFDRCLLESIAWIRHNRPN